MKRLLFLLSIYCITGYTNKALAQWTDAMVDNHSIGKVALSTYGNVDFSANSITSDFAFNFLSGNYINNNLKQEVSSHLKNNNRLGYSLNYGLYGVLYNDTVSRKRIFNFFFALRHKRYINTSFSPDDFNIGFYGNAGYAGKTAQLSPFYMNNLAYQQGEIGLVCTNFGGNAQFGIGLSFLAGQQYSSISVPYAALYTDPLGESLSFNSNAQAYSSDTSSGYLKRINGYGASIDLYFRAPYVIGKKQGTITINVTDIGFIWWNQQSLSYQKDTGYSYNGIAITNLTDLKNASFNTFSKDSLRNKYFPFQKGGFYSQIPVTLNTNANTALSQKFHLELGFWYIFNANAVGYSYVQADKYFTHDWMVALQAGYGGYGTINGAVLFAKQFKTSHLGISLDHLQGIILPKQFGGAGCYLEYVYSFDKWK